MTKTDAIAFLQTHDESLIDPDFLDLLESILDDDDTDENDDIIQTFLDID